MIGRRTVARLAFVGFAIAWAVAAHWPRIEIRGPAIPHLDKAVHAGAFACWTVLLSLTGWCGDGPGARRRLALAAVLYAAVDELTQALPGIGRDADLADFFADLAGIAVGLVCAALLGRAGTRRGP
ncbi:MAG: hypothetical protein D6693_03470 [Planctomycetota bacterium]|nr:MAG: hypothetical protein D6693_03470 [Planctomycetota bacterium]